MHINKINILKKFFETDFFKNKILSNKNIIFAFLSGSQLLNLSTENSDYDLILVYSDHIDKSQQYSEEGKNIIFKYLNIEINIWFQNIQYFYIYDLEKCPSCTVNYCLYPHITNDDIIYKNSKYNKFIYYFLNNKYLNKKKYEIAYNSVIPLKEQFYEIIEKKNKFPKYYYRALKTITLKNPQLFNESIAKKIKNNKNLNDLEYKNITNLFLDYFIKKSNITNKNFQKQVDDINILIYKNFLNL